MSTIVSIILYALATFLATMIGFGAGRAKSSPVDEETQNVLVFLTVVFALFFVLAVALQVAA